MSLLIYHIASGQAFFTGMALVVAGCLLLCREARWAKRLGLLALVLGVIAAAISSTPVPWFIGGLLVLAVIAWPVLLKRRNPKRKWLAAAPLIASCFLAAGYEATYPGLCSELGNSWTSQRI